MLRHFTTLPLSLVLSVVLLATLGLIPSVFAQPGTLPANQANVIAEEAAQAAAAQASAAQEPQAAPTQTPPNGSGPQSLGGESKPSEGSGKSSSDKANPESGEAGKNVQRENAPPAPPNPEELNARPNADGLLEFQFRNQPWPKLLSWLAEVSQQSLDWRIHVAGKRRGAVGRQSISHQSFDGAAGLSSGTGKPNAASLRPHLFRALLPHGG